MQRVFTSIPQKRKHPMGSHYPGTSLRGANSHAKTKETHEQSTFSCPAASFCSGQDLIGALNQQIRAVLHFSSLLVCCIPRHTKMRSTMICASNEIISAMKEKSESWAEICILTKHFFKAFFFPLNSGEIFYSRHFCPNLGSLILYSKSILRVFKMWSLCIQEIARPFLE